MVQFGESGQERRIHFAIELTKTVERRGPEAPKNFVGCVQDPLFVLREGRVGLQPRPQIRPGRDVRRAGEAGPHHGPPERVDYRFNYNTPAVRRLARLYIMDEIASMNLLYRR